MAGFRYAQFCPVARAAELLGERWTLLILRELFLGPQRFSDLRRRLRGISTSVLSDRLVRLEERRVVARRELEPPAASTVYELTEAGGALLPALAELARWGARFLLPPVPGDHVELDWVRMALRVFARQTPTPERSFELHIVHEERELVAHIVGGPDGTAVTDGPGPADAVLRTSPLVFFGLMSGALQPGEAVSKGRLGVEGDSTALESLSELFKVNLGVVTGRVQNAIQPPS